MSGDGTFRLTHMTEDNKPTMVDVSEKPQSYRVARASGSITLTPETIGLIKEDKMKKGNVLVTAELAGIQAAKRTWELIPLCHQLLLTKIKVNAELTETGVSITSEVKCTGQTGVEMEALTGVSTALLTIYDMCKAVDTTMVIGDIKLLEKTKEEI